MNKHKVALLTVPQTFEMALDWLRPVVDAITDEDVKQQLLMTVTYMQSLVEAQAVMENMLEASMSNFTLAMRQRDYALKAMTLWQEQGVDQALDASTAMVSKDILEGADPEAVRVALARVLGFDVGVVPVESLNKVYEGLDEIVRAIEGESSPDGDGEGDNGFNAGSE